MGNNNHSFTVLSARGIIKRYESLLANDHINFDIKNFEVHALLGENGAGKTTLLNILYGILRPDDGFIYINGKEVKLYNTREAIIKYKIGKVSQHSDLVPTFNVLKNILYGKIPTKFGLFIDKIKSLNIFNNLCKITNFHLDPNAIVENLSVGEQQHIELLKLLYQNAEIIFLDEPSSLLTVQEVENLFKLIHSMAKEGRSIIYVTHKLDEALRCDKITVLRKGKVVLSKSRKDIDKNILLNAMFGKKIELVEKKAEIITKREPILLEVKNLCTKYLGKRSNLKNISFTLHKGEILGIAGIAGNGQKELLDVITGFEELQSGKIYLKGTNITRNVSTNWLRRKNIFAYIPEGRNEMGSFLSLPIKHNIIMGKGRKNIFFPKNLRDKRKINNFSNELINEYEIKISTINSKTSSLSGGNLQKLIVARELSINTDLFIVSQPTWGVDFKTTEFIHKVILQKAEEGKSLLLVSKDLNEILKLSDRILVIRDGKIKEVPKEKSNAEEIGKLMLGL